MEQRPRQLPIFAAKILASAGSASAIKRVNRQLSASQLAMHSIYVRAEDEFILLQKVLCSRLCTCVNYTVLQFAVLSLYISLFFRQKRFRLGKYYTLECRRSIIVLRLTVG